MIDVGGVWTKGRAYCCGSTSKFDIVFVLAIHGCLCMSSVKSFFATAISLTTAGLTLTADHIALRDTQACLKEVH